MANKQFPPSARKLRKAREEGDVAKGRDVTSLVVLISCICTLICLSGGLLEPWTILDENLVHFRDFSSNNMLVYLGSIVKLLISILGSLFGVLTLSAIFAESCQVGVHLNFRLVAIKFSRLNPVENLKRNFGFSSDGEERKAFGVLFYEIFRSSFYIGILLTSLVGFLCFHLVDISGADYQDPQGVLFLSYKLGIRLVGTLLALILVAAVSDFIIHRHRRIKRLYMDVEELRKELRESEGDPETKGMRKQLHQEMLLHSVIQAVRRAKVVIVNSASSISSD